MSSRHATDHDRRHVSLADHTWPVFLNSSDTNLLADFFGPALSSSVNYDRAVGYFSSGWLRMAADGMIRFAANGGQARWVTSPILDERDWEALLSGDNARRDPALRKAIEEDVADLAEALEKETLSALAWMVADGVLTFKLALPREKLAGGEFHDKFGVFGDASGNRIVFNGSYNDSIQGNRNYESITVFSSCEPAHERLVDETGRRFERLWNNTDPNVQVFDLPKAARDQILRLRGPHRPYQEPEWVKKEREHPQLGNPARPSVPDDLLIRDYQLEAIEAWFENEGRGLLEMATGTGKTITALAASTRLYEREGRLAVIIACPYQHLVDQWFKEAERFGYAPLRAYQSRNTWLDDLNERAMAYNSGDTDRLCVITTHASFSTAHFQRTVERIEGPTLLIADEAHHLGAETSRRRLPEKVAYRLGLSATPDRWYDDKGTAALRSYFGQTVYRLSLADAIGVSLTPYYYYPVLVELTGEELDAYRVLSAKIGRLMAQSKGEENEQLTQLLVKRAQLLNVAENKLGVISEYVDRQPDMTHTLFYCAPGQIDDVVRTLGWEKRLKVHRFTAREDIPTRRSLLEGFANGDLQALAAMHCLDEGVDVPSTQTAYILASSSNPRQFIQRRGRVLRKFPGKNFATIYDLVAVPPARELGEAELKAERAILKRELRRFAEFADSALNTQSAYEVIWELADQYEVLDF